MKRVIVSDLHLGTASGRDLLRREPVLDALRSGLEEAGELVLLGDVVELRETPVADALAAARPVLAAIGAALDGRRITIVPGNHDHELARPLLDGVRVRGRPLALDASAPPPRSGPLAAVARALAPAEVRLAYPGAWVRDDVGRADRSVGVTHAASRQRSWAASQMLRAAS